MHLKSLYLISFSLAFLAKGMTADYSHNNSYQRSEDMEDEENSPYFEEDNYLQASRRDQKSYDDEADAYDDDYVADADDGQMPMRSRQRSRSESEACLSPFRRVHISARHNEARGIGYHNGYTTLEVFGIYDQYSKYFMPFLDLRGHVFNNGKLAGNVGIGERTVIPSIDHTFGSYLYYDVRNVGHHLVINQLSPGLELVGKRMEYRINGYFPVGRDESHRYGYQFNKFRGHHILLKAKQFRALKGGDAEIGVHITQSTHYDLYAAAGSYYLQASHASSWGGRTRLLGRYKEYFALEVAYSYDHLFRSVVQGSVALTLPLGAKLQRMGRTCPQANDLLLSRASFSPSRFEIPMAKKTHPRRKAINPATHKPWFVWFVNNTSSSKGTFESPFPTLAQAQNASSPNQMIYVFPGDGTTKGMDAGITLQDGQYFYGSGIRQNLPTTKGRFTIPAMSSGFPSLTNAPLMSSVLVANENVVSGFNFLSDHGVSNIGGFLVGTGVGLTVANNTFSNPLAVFDAIIFNGSGRVNIYNNQIVGTGPMPTGSGILLRVVDGTLMTGKIAHNSVSGTLQCIAVAPNGPLNTGVAHMTIEDNAVSNFAVNGIIANLLPAGSKIKILKNLVNNTLGTQPIIAFMDGSVTIQKNSIEQSSPLASTGITVFPLSSNLNANISNNAVTVGATTGSIGLNSVANAGQSLCVNIDGNIVTNGTLLRPAFQFNTDATGTINLESFADNVGTGLNVLGTGTFNLVPEGTCSN
jgi:hypothetical protein